MKNNRVLQKYEITYHSNGFKQYKYLVSRDDWEEIIKPLQAEIASLPKDSPLKIPLKKKLEDLFIDGDKCFPPDSPLYNSIETGIISLLPHQGGDHKVSWKLLN